MFLRIFQFYDLFLHPTLKKNDKKVFAFVMQGSVRLNNLLDQQSNDQSPLTEPPILASELVCGVTAALGVCFDVARLSRHELERDSLAQAGYKLTEVSTDVEK